MALFPAVITRSRRLANLAQLASTWDACVGCERVPLACRKMPLACIRRLLACTKEASRFHKQTFSHAEGNGSACRRKSLACTNKPSRLHKEALAHPERSSRV